MAVLLSTVLFESEAKTATKRPFFSVEEIKRFIVQSKNYRLDGTDPLTAVPLLIYQAPFQQTWLVKTIKRLYCILDDLRKAEPNINWSMPMTDVLDDAGEIKLQIAAHPPSGKDERTGKIDFGPKKDWLYSTKLFTVRSIEDEIRALLKA